MKEDPLRCSVPNTQLDDSFESLMEAFGSQNYWVRFFMRPCCPPPGESTAREQIEHLKSDISLRSDFSTDQKKSLMAVADERLTWYLTLPVRHTA